MIEIFDLELKRVAILENAFDRVEETQMNSVAQLTFSLPESDPKTEYCRPFWYVRNDGGQLYRIISPSEEMSVTGIITYQCEHVIATLIDDVLFGQHVVGNLGTYTRDVIEYVLEKQTVTRWVLGDCDFSRQYEYGWENENLLAALFSIPNRFVSPYIWTFDTDNYPWTVSLKQIDESGDPQYYIQAGKNLLSYKEDLAAKDICTKLYCLGYGEGINQLTISDVNGGLPYLLAPQEKIDEYGLITRIWVDRRFEDAESLKQRGQVLLDSYVNPVKAKTFSVADLYELTDDDFDRAEVGKIAMFTADGTKTYITQVKRNHDKAGDLQITLATKAGDVAGTISELADRQRIEEVYSQGATQIYAQSVQANATSDVKAVLNFYIPAEMRIVNAVKVKISLSAFRSYSKATLGGGRTTATSAAGGGSTYTSSAGGGSTYTSSSGGGGSTTSSSGGGSSTTSSSGGGGSTTSSSGGYSTTTSGATALNSSNATSYDTGGYGSANHNHGIASSYWVLLSTGGTTATATARWTPSGAHTHPAHSHQIQTPNHTHTITIGAHTHTVNIPAHTHQFSVNAHSHSVTISAHTHTVQISSHTHTVEIPNHTHDIEQGIFTFGSPSSAKLYVNGQYKANVNTNAEMDITDYLIGNGGKIDRGAWHKIEVLPNDKAYVTIDMMIQGFIQSRGGNTV